jgi:two-component system chemotaxis response regulator CheY
MAKIIFIVDDSPTMTMSIATTLQINGYIVEKAVDGVDALEQLKKGLKPNLIITDINMPRMGGLELIREIKQIPSLRFTPILTLTTESDPSKKDEGKKLGATGWMVKPIAGPDLLKVIQQVLPG